MEITARPAYSRILALPAQLKAASVDGGRFIEGMASTGSLDETAEIIKPSAFTDGMAKFMEHPILSYIHSWWDPIGKVVDYDIRDEGLWIRARLLDEGTNELADRVWQLIDQEVVRALSVGFDPGGTRDAPPGYADEETNVWIWERIQLREIAVTPLPANYEATLAAAKSLGLNLSLPLVGQTKGVVPYQDLPLAPEEREWDAAAARKRLRSWAGGDDIDWAKYRTGFIWFDSENPEVVASYKLPIADVIDGELRAVWRAVAGGMGALMGSRGGVDIPEADADKAYAHLARYYKRFDKEPPEKALTLSDLPADDPAKVAYEENLFADNLSTVRAAAIGAVNIARAWRKDGRAISAAPLGVVTEALDFLHELAEPYPLAQDAGAISGEVGPLRGAVMSRTPHNLLVPH